MKIREALTTHPLQFRPAAPNKIACWLPAASRVTAIRVSPDGQSPVYHLNAIVDGEVFERYAAGIELVLGDQVALSNGGR